MDKVRTVIRQSSLCILGLFLALVLTGCTHSYDGFSDMGVKYYSVSEVSEEIESNPDDVVNVDDSEIKAIHVQGYAKDLKERGMTFTLTDTKNNDLRCSFDQEPVGTEFFSKVKESDWVRLDGRIWEDESGYYYLVNSFKY